MNVIDDTLLFLEYSLNAENIVLGRCIETTGVRFRM